jgi:hypothetical protein
LVTRPRSAEVRGIREHGKAGDRHHTPAEYD